jgi:hypothetical protein
MLIFCTDTAPPPLHLLCSIRDEKVTSQIGSEDKEKIEKALHDAVEWLDHNQQAEVRQGVRRPMWLLCCLGAGRCGNLYAS